MENFYKKLDKKYKEIEYQIQYKEDESINFYRDVILTRYIPKLIQENLDNNLLDLAGNFDFSINTKENTIIFNKNINEKITLPDKVNPEIVYSLCKDFRNLINELNKKIVNLVLKNLLMLIIWKFKVLNIVTMKKKKIKKRNL